MKCRIPIVEPKIGKEELEKVMEAVRSGWVSSKGPFIEEFEEEFSSFIGMKHGVTTSSGTSALHLALAALGVGRGDEVLVPSLTFVATANAVAYTGAEPVFLDSHREYWCLDPSEIEERVNSKTKVIIPVHLYGHPCDMGQIMPIAEDYKLHVVEDCAEAHGAKYKDRKVGSYGIINSFSFYGNKIITTGDGGMCLTDDEELADRMKLLRNHGMNPDKKYWHDVIGFSYKMTNVQAALGVAQIGRIDRIVAEKRRIAATYEKLLEDLPGVAPAPEMSWAKSVYWLYSVLVEKEVRDRTIQCLEEQGIEASPFFHPIHTLPPYNKSLELPVAEDLSAMGLNLPSSPLLSDEQIREVVETLREAVNRHAS